MYLASKARGRRRSSAGSTANPVKPQRHRSSSRLTLLAAPYRQRGPQSRPFVDIIMSSHSSSTSNIMARLPSPTFAAAPKLLEVVASRQTRLPHLIELLTNIKWHSTCKKHRRRSCQHAHDPDQRQVARFDAARNSKRLVSRAKVALMTGMATAYEQRRLHCRLAP